MTKRRQRARRLAALALSLLVFVVSSACSDSQVPAAPHVPGTLRMTVFELELHGLAIALETPSGAVWFVDTGKEEKGYDAGKETLAPFLERLCTREVAGIVVSHPDKDHFEGAAYLLKHFKVKSFVDAGLDRARGDDSYSKLKARARESGADCKVVHGGDVLQWDPALEVTVLAPPKDGVKSADKKFLDNNSLVLRIRHGKNVFLLPGDIEQEGGESLLATVPAESLRATVLVAPHHGFFADPGFAQVVRPQIVVVSCQAEYAGKEQPFPGRLASETFGAVGSQVYVTAWNGTVTIVSDGTTCATHVERTK